MANEFIGCTYWYPTPNDSRKEIGVLLVTEDLYIVGWRKPTGIKRLVSPHLKPNRNPVELHCDLDEFARQRGLEKVKAVADERKANQEAREIAADIERDNGFAAAAGGMDAAVIRGQSVPPAETGSETLSEGGAGGTGNAVPPASESASAEHCTNARALCGRGNEPSAMVSAMVAETSLVRRELQVTLPDRPEAYGPVIRECLDRERQGGLQAAVLIALQRQQLWPKKTQFNEWLAWAMENLGLARRSCFMYLKVGNLLTSQMVTELPAELQKKLLACTIPKLEQLARLAAGQLTMVLTKRDPGAMAWDQVKDLVDGLLIPADERKRLKDDAAAREEQRKDPVFRITSFAEEIERLAGGESLKRKAVIQRVDPGKALVGGMALALIGIEAERNRHTMDVKNLAEAKQYAQAIVDGISKLQEV